MRPHDPGVRKRASILRPRTAGGSLTAPPDSRDGGVPGEVRAAERPG